MTSSDHRPAYTTRKKDDGPKNGNAENLPYRIAGLEKAKLEPGMSVLDIAALDRAIAKLKDKLAAKTESKKEEV
ncbi:MAG: hypothetical protein ABI643_01005 [Candidatus Doudnabacteria bacterium]